MEYTNFKPFWVKFTPLPGVHNQHGLIPGEEYLVISDKFYSSGSLYTLGCTDKQKRKEEGYNRFWSFNVIQNKEESFQMEFAKKEYGITYARRVPKECFKIIEKNNLYGIY